METAKYKITGLVDIFDEQGVITGQFPIGSVQELPVEVGTKLVAEGTVEAVGSEEGDEVAEDETTGEDDLADEPTGETGEDAPEEEEDGDSEDEVV